MAIQLEIFGIIFKRFKKKPAPTRVFKQPVNDINLKNLWLSIRLQYFPSRPDLDHYQISWSTRNQKRTLASCNVYRKKVVVARELNYPEYEQWLEPLIYHEMCHAYLGKNVPQKNGKRAWHGKDFKRLEKLHPSMNCFEKWIKAGGWATAVRSDRAKRAHLKRRLAA